MPLINILISNENPLPREHDLLLLIFEAGLQYFHLRKPNLSKQELREYINRIPYKEHNKIVIHSHYTLLDEFDLKGVHLPEMLYNEISEKKDFMDLRNRTQHVSTSFHLIKSLEQYNKDLDYVFISPVFESISKRGYKPTNFNRQELIQAIQKSKYKVVGVGGMHQQNMDDALSIGFYGLAFLGAVWQSPDAVRAFVEICSKRGRVNDGFRI